MVSKTYSLFGGEVTFSIDTEESLGEILLDEAYDLGLHLQKVFNLYDNKSELSLLNKKREMPVSPELLEVLRVALDLSQRSQGEYDISKGKNFLQRKKGVPIEQISCSYKDIQIQGQTVRLLHKDIWVDLGSLAKGYIAQKIAEFLQNQGVASGYIDARGDIMTFGSQQMVNVQHPRKENKLCTIRLENIGVATSGDYKQFTKSYEDSHIINKKEIISATVVAKNLMLADAYATLALVCTRKTREALMRESKFPALVVDKNLNVTCFNNFENIIKNGK